MKTNYALGFGSAAVAVLCFGSNFVPVKKFETGDGIFFQWMLCSAVWVCGFIVHAIRGFPPFRPLALLGGFLWCTGNMLTVPIVKMIGLSMGLLLWGMVNLIMGWSSGTFGLFGLKKEGVPHPNYNYTGFALAVFSTGIFVLVKPTVSTKVERDAIEQEDSVGLINNDFRTEQVSWVDKLSDLQKRILGVTLSAVAGIFYGVNFDPVVYLQDNHEDYSKNGLDYVFSHFSGIYLTSTFYFMVYCLFKRNKPVVYQQSIFPAFISGALWAIADISWFITNSNLSLVIAFPIITTGPGIIASLWGIFMFKEIQGLKNFVFLALAFCVTVAAVVCISISKIQ